MLVAEQVPVEEPVVHVPVMEEVVVEVSAVEEPTMEVHVVEEQVPRCGGGC